MDASDWAREARGFSPDEAQAQVLSSATKHGLLNCARQWGKSTVTTVKAVHQAWTAAGSLTLVVNPSARQSGEFVRRLKTPRWRAAIRTLGR